MKLFPFVFAAAFAFQAVAQEDVFADNEDVDLEVEATDEAPRGKSALWPAFFAICQWPDTPDLVGLRLTLPFSTKQENVTGFDVGLWGRSAYFEGLQVNVLRNDVKDTCAGIQIGLYNSVGLGDLSGMQIGLWNESLAFRGLQIGLVNVSGDSSGFQVGVINRCETMYGFQVGVINVIRDAEVQFMPFLNIGF